MNGRLYDLCGRAGERKGLAERRSRLVADLEGDVLELGAGTGFTLPHYRRARKVVAAEPDGSMAARLRERVQAASVPVEIVDAEGEQLPFPDASFDHVVTALVLCSVRDVDRTLSEVRRVLRRGGTLVFLEHVRGSGRVARWQERLTPLHRRLMGNCHLNRETSAALVANGFEPTRIERFSLPGGHPLVRPAIQGVATRMSS